MSGDLSAVDEMKVAFDRRRQLIVGMLDAIPGVLRKGQAMDREDLMRALLDHLGFHRLTDPAREALRSTLNAAIRRGVLEAGAFELG